MDQKKRQLLQELKKVISNHKTGKGIIIDTTHNKLKLCDRNLIYLSRVDQIYIEFYMRKIELENIELPSSFDLMDLRNLARRDFKYTYQNTKLKESIEILNYAIVGEYESNGMENGIEILIKELAKTLLEFKKINPV